MGRDDRGAAVLDAADALVAAQREWGGIVAGLIRLTGDWDLAEECAQDAVERALHRWPVDGVPERPAAWLTTTARHRALDVLRRRATEARKLEEVAAMELEAAAVPGAPFDDQLCLVFTCCHPALSMEARVALTLRSVSGLSSTEIARAFLVEERTMVQRLFRAKRKIRDAAIPFRVPPPDRMAERLDAVLAVLYLMFNEGYRPATGSGADRVDLSDEAIRLAGLLVELLADEPEAVGLLVLMELHDARRAARTDASGELVPLDEQDRDQWDHERIRRGAARLDAAVAVGRPGPYQVQAAIAACHATATRAADTDWLQIAALYGRLAELAPGPVVELNRAVAVAMADGPDVALGLVDALAARGDLDGYHLLPATRADLLRRLGRRADAAAAYRDAIALARNDADARFLTRHLSSL